MLPTDSLHCLTIDLEHATPVLGQGFELPADEIRDLLCLAGRDGLQLIVLCMPSALTLVSTSRHHVRAFRPVLARLRERIQDVDGWRTLPVRIASGCDAGRQLLRQAIPSSDFEPEIRNFVRTLRTAAELSSTCGAFSAELGALVRMTENAAARVGEETRLGRPGSSAAEAEVETLAAERIFEEELVAWQSSCPALRSRRPPAESDISQFTGEERESMIRIRVANVLTKLRTA
jgi:hypothetical protein